MISRSGSGNLNRRVRRNPSGAFECRNGLIPPRGQIGCDLLVSGGLGTDARQLSSLTGSNRRKIEKWKGDRKAQGIILRIRSEAIQPAESRSIDSCAGSPGVGGSLRQKPGNERLLENQKFRFLLLNERILFGRNGILRGVEWGRLLFEGKLKQLRGGYRDLLRLNAQKLREERAGYLFGLLRLNQLRAGRRKFGFGSRCIGARTQLSIGLRPNGLREHLGPIHAGLGRPNCFLRG